VAIGKSLADLDTAARSAVPSRFMTVQPSLFATPHRPMSPPGRPKGEYRSAQREGTPMSPPGRPKGEYRSAQREGTPVNLRTDGR